MKLSGVNYCNFTRYIEMLVEFKRNPTGILISPDLYDKLYLKGIKEVMTSKGHLKIKIVSKHNYLRVEDGIDRAIERLK